VKGTIELKIVTQNRLVRNYLEWTALANAVKSVSAARRIAKVGYESSHFRNTGADDKPLGAFG